MLELRAIKAATDRLGITAEIDYLGGGIYSLVSGRTMVGPAGVQADGTFVGTPGDFYLTTTDKDGDEERSITFWGLETPEAIASLMADHVGLVMTCGACERRYADNTPAGRCPWEADHPEPVLTPYDTGARLQPKVWQVNRLDLVNPERKDGAERYGKVDFELDDSSTALTIYVTQDANGITVHVIPMGDDEITITQHRE